MPQANLADQPPQPMTLPERVERAKTRQALWAAAAEVPGLSPEARLAAVDLARSWRAAETLGKKALAHEAGQDPGPSEDEMLASALGIPSPQHREKQADLMIFVSSIEQATSGSTTSSPPPRSNPT